MMDGDFSISYLDTDKEGVITKQEYLPGGANNSEKIFNHIDANNDGLLDLAEQKEVESIYSAIYEKHKAKTTTI